MAHTRLAMLSQRPFLGVLGMLVEFKENRLLVARTNFLVNHTLKLSRKRAAQGGTADGGGRGRGHRW